MAEVKIYEFEYHGGAVIKDGKSHWPNMIRFSLDRYQAMQMARQIIDYYTPETYLDQKIEIAFHGKLEQVDE